MNTNKEQVIDAIAKLEDIRNQVFDSVINVGMYGVYADINRVFEAGDSYVFELGHFDNTKDPSLQALVRLVKHLDHCKATLLRINNLSMEEVDL